MIRLMRQPPLAHPCLLAILDALRSMPATRLCSPVSDSEVYFARNGAEIALFLQPTIAFCWSTTMVRMLSALFRASLQPPSGASRLACLQVVLVPDLEPLADMIPRPDHRATSQRTNSPKRETFTARAAVVLPRLRTPHPVARPSYSLLPNLLPVAATAWLLAGAHSPATRRMYWPRFHPITCQHPHTTLVPFIDRVLPLALPLSYFSAISSSNTPHFSYQIV